MTIKPEIEQVVMQERLFAHLEPRYDSLGQYIHPQWSKYWDDHFQGRETITDEEYEQAKKHLNIEIKSINIEDDDNVGVELFEDIYFLENDKNLSDWKVEIPEGWFLLLKIYTEDGVYCAIARNIYGELL